MKKILHVLILGVFLLSGAGANAQFSEEELTMQRLQDRINSLEKNLITVQQELYRSGKSNKARSKQAGNISEEPIGSDEERTRALNGKFEEVEHSVSTLASKLDKIISDIDFRISALEKKVNALPAPDAVSNINQPVDTAPEALAVPAADAVNPVENAAPATPATPVAAAPAAKAATKAAPAKTNAATQYEKAFEFLRQAKYDESEKAFKDFIANNKDSDLLGNAYYWLGETYYIRTNYQQAAVNFLKGYQDFPKGNKAPDSLLKLAMSLKNLKKEKEACATIDKMKKEYPEADKDLLLKADAERKGLKCK